MMENKQSITFNPDMPKDMVNVTKETKLTAWFNLNMENPSARVFTYLEHFAWDSTKKMWKPRTRCPDIVTCVG